jgi:hypothetical protein
MLKNKKEKTKSSLKQSSLSQQISDIKKASVMEAFFLLFDQTTDVEGGINTSCSISHYIVFLASLGPFVTLLEHHLALSDGALLVFFECL